MVGEQSCLAGAQSARLRLALRPGYGFGVAFCLALFALPTISPAQDEALTLITELLRDPDKDIRAVALEQVRTEAKGEAATRKFAELLLTLPPETQVGLLSALAARGDAAAAPEVRQMLAEAKVESVRLAAIDAIGRLGNATDVGLFVELLVSGNDAAQKAARQSLIRLPDPKASEAIIEEIPRVSAAQRVALIEILTERHAGEDQLLNLALDDDPQIRRAAMQALSQIAGPEHIAKMAQAVLKAEPGAERIAAERAIATVCRRIDDPQQQAAPLLDAMNQLDAQKNLQLIPAVGRVGGPMAFSTAAQAYEDSDASVHAAGLAAICNWPDGAVVGRLLEAARSDEHLEHRTTARRALIRIAPLEDSRSDARRLDLLKTLFAMCPDDAERKQVLERAKAVRTVETLRFVAPWMDQDSLSQQACATVVELAHHIALRESHKEEFHRALDKVIATSQDETVIDRAHRYKAGQTWVRPKLLE